MISVVCVNNNIFLDQLSAISRRINPDCDFSLAAGRDLFRKRNSRASSPGFHFFYLKNRAPLVQNNKIMNYLGAVQNRLKFMAAVRYSGIRPSLLFASVGEYRQSHYINQKKTGNNQFLFHVTLSCILFINSEIFQRSYMNRILNKNVKKFINIILYDVCPGKGNVPDASLDSINQAEAGVAVFSHNFTGI